MSSTSHRRPFYAVTALDYGVDFHVIIVAALLVLDRTGSVGALYAVAASNWLSETLFEVPTGFIADRFGRTLSAAASFALRGVGYLVIALANSVPVFILGWVLVGLGSTLLSGALEAWAVDREIAGDGDVDALLLRAQRVASVAMVGAIALSVVVGSLSYAAPFAVSGAAGLLLAPIVLLWLGADKAPGRAGKLGASGNAVVFRRAVFSPAYLPLFGVGALLSLSLAIPAVQWAPAVEESFPALVLLPLGLVRALGPALRALINGPVEWFVGRLGRKNVFAGLLLSSASLLAAGAVATGVGLVVLFALFAALSTIAPVLLHSRLNEVVEHPQWRATVLSMNSAIAGLITGGGLLVVGGLVGEIGNRQAVWSLAALGMTVLACVPLFYPGLLSHRVHAHAST